MTPNFGAKTGRMPWFTSGFVLRNWRDLIQSRFGREVCRSFSLPRRNRRHQRRTDGQVGHARKDAAHCGRVAQGFRPHARRDWKIRPKRRQCEPWLRGKTWKEHCQHFLQRYIFATTHFPGWPVVEPKHNRFALTYPGVSFGYVDLRPQYLNVTANAR